MEQVVCGRDNTPMQAVYPFRCQNGAPGLRYRCPRCNGQVDLVQNNGRWQPVGLGQLDDRPRAFRPGDKLDIQPAYTIGRVPGYRHPAPTPSVRELLPQPAYQSNQHVLPPGHPMHPDQIRQRMLGLTSDLPGAGPEHQLEDFGG